MGRVFCQSVLGDKVYSCAHCRTALVDYGDCVSKAFQGRHGRAYLFANVLNVVAGEPQDRTLITGLHTVADIECVGCRAVLGWTYLRAHDPTQRYKEGRYILEKARIAKDGWM